MWAQDAPYLGKGTSEVNAFAGISYGLDAVRGSFGGNYAYSVNKYLMPYGEVSYFPGINRDLRIPIGGTTDVATARQAIPFIDYHGGVHLRRPIPGSNWVPYLVIGAGAVTARSRLVPVNVPIGGGQVVRRDVTVEGETAFAVNGGGGLRYYFKENVGFRLEAKIYKPTGTYSDPFFKAVFGLFFYIKK